MTELERLEHAFVAGVESCGETQAKLAGLRWKTYRATLDLTALTERPGEPEPELGEAEIPDAALVLDGIVNIPQLMVSLGLAPRLGAAKDLITAHAVRLDDMTVKLLRANVREVEGKMLKVGKRHVRIAPGIAPKEPVMEKPTLTELTDMIEYLEQLKTYNAATALTNRQAINSLKRILASLEVPSPVPAPPEGFEWDGLPWDEIRHPKGWMVLHASPIPTEPAKELWMPKFGEHCKSKLDGNVCIYVRPASIVGNHLFAFALHHNLQLLTLSEVEPLDSPDAGGSEK